MLVYLYYDESSDGGEISPGEEGESWPRHEDEYRTFEPTSLRLTEDKKLWQKETVDIDFPAKIGDTIYVVIVRYTDGGTFGCTHGYWQLEKFCATLQEAKEISHSIYKNTYKGYKYWLGYFASLDSVDIEPMILES